MAWILTYAEVNRVDLLGALAAAYPPPGRNRPSGSSAASRGVSEPATWVRRYERIAGRTATSPQWLTEVITGVT